MPTPSPLLLAIHFWLGSLVVLLALLAIFWDWARRAVQYAIVVQVLLGAAVWAFFKVQPNFVHWVVPLFVAGAYPPARAIVRRGGSPARARFICVVAFVLILVVF